MTAPAIAIHGWRDEPTLRQAGVVVSVAGLLLAVAGEVWGRTADISDPLVLPAVVAVYIGLLVTLHTAVGRVSGSPTVWFTAAVPAVVALAAIMTEAVHVFGLAVDTSAISLVLVPVALTVALVGAHRARRRWRSGLMAWSMVLFHGAVAVGALAGIPLGTFGDVTRSDELLVLGAVLPVIAIAIALPFAPGTPWPIRLAGPVLVGAVVPAFVATEMPAVGLAVAALLSVSVATVGTRRPDHPEEGASPPG